MRQEEFRKEYAAIVERALEFSSEARAQGLLVVLEMIDEEKFFARDVFELGIILILEHGERESDIELILSNIIGHETDPDRQLLKMIQKEAVWQIRKYTDEKTLFLILSSFVDFDVEASMRRYMNYYEDLSNPW
jgi:hypothetical protein